MRVASFLASAVFTSVLIVLLNTNFILPAPLGKLLSPQHGVWQNAEPASGNFAAQFKFPQLSGKVDVYLDDRLVPHIFAEHTGNSKGFRSEVGLGWRIPTSSVAGNWTLSPYVSAQVNSAKLADYYYGVTAAEAIANRPAYQAKGGYAGMQMLAAVSKRYPKFWVGGFASWSNLNGAAYEDSPLVKTKNSLAAGVAIAWIFSESKTLVEAKE